MAWGRIEQAGYVAVAERKFKIVNQLGIHARPASLIVKTASRFDADIFFEKDGSRVSGKSIMGLMTLAASSGTVLMALVEGPDEEEALDALEELFDSRFGEE